MGSIESIKTDNSIIDFNSTFSTNNGSFNDGSSVEVINNSGTSDNIVVDDYDFNTDVNNNDVSFLEMITPKVSLEIESPDTIDADVLTLNNGLDSGSIGSFNFIDENGNVFSLKEYSLIDKNFYYYTLIDADGGEHTVIGYLNGDKMILAKNLGYCSDGGFILQYNNGNFEYFDGNGNLTYSYKGGDLIYGGNLVSSDELGDVFNFSKESGKEFSYVLNMYIRCKENGIVLNYGTISKEDGWWENYVYFGQSEYSGFFGTVKGESGFVYKIPFQHMEAVGKKKTGYINYYDYDTETFEKYVVALSSYIDKCENFMGGRLSSYFLERVQAKTKKDKEGYPVICIVDYNQRWNGITGQSVCMDGKYIMNSYDSSIDGGFTNNSRVVGSLVHEFGHMFDYGHHLSNQKPWQDVGKQLLEYMYDVGKDPTANYVTVNIGANGLSRVRYSDYMYLIDDDHPNGWTKDEVWDFLDYEFFTEFNRIYYQNPGALQDIPIDYTDSFSNNHYDNLFDFMNDLNNGKITNIDSKGRVEFSSESSNQNRDSLLSNQDDKSLFEKAFFG